MELPHFLHKMHARNQRKPLGNGTLLYSPPELAAVLEKERSRADRNSHVFSLVLFGFPDTATADALFDDLANIVIRRMRFIDELGWFNDNTLGVVMPYTDRDGAHIFSANIQQAMQEVASAPVCSIYTYPGQWFPGGSPGKRSGETTIILPNAKPAAPPSQANATTSVASDSRPRPRSDAPLRRPLQEHRYLSALLIPGIPIWKRAMDILGASIGLLIMAPILLPLMAWIKLVSPGPAFFKQERVGLNGKYFLLWKLRTMRVNHNIQVHRDYLSTLIKDTTGERVMHKQEDNPAIIRGGRLIRAMSLDEFPQLINVLRGEMSLVGPRPPLPYEAREYQRWHASRFDTVPGMSGLWQVSGKNKLTFQEMVRLDISYVRRRSPLLDVVILLRTPWVVVRQAVETILRKGRPHAS